MKLVSSKSIWIMLSLRSFVANISLKKVLKMKFWRINPWKGRLLRESLKNIKNQCKLVLWMSLINPSNRIRDSSKEMIKNTKPPIFLARIISSLQTKRTKCQGLGSQPRQLPDLSLIIKILLFRKVLQSLPTITTAQNIQVLWPKWEEMSRNLLKVASPKHWELVESSIFDFFD